MRTFSPRERPESWSAQKASAAHKWVRPFLALDWCMGWSAYYLSNWKFLEVLEYMSSLSILVAVIFYFSESGDRTKQKHYQAWQVINTAQGKGGSGGRLEALQELNSDRVPLVGVDVSGAFLMGIELKGSKLVRANFSGADVRNSDLSGVDFSDANLQSANFRYSKFRKTSFERAQLDDADLVGADLTGADLSGASLTNVDLRNTNLTGIQWRNIASIKGANIHIAQNAPEGFATWALQNGAIDAASEPESKSQ
ncbi:MAG: pentapeptide repeat-containing protein [Candidatus Acidiferrales bacterium]